MSARIFTTEEFKFEILRALTARQQAQNKFNLLGRPGTPGELELGQRLEFDNGQRALAYHAFNALSAAGFIQPTYADLVDPENWFAITDAGRHALETGFLDELDEALSRISGHLVEVRRGAWSALMSGRPDSLRQATHSARELIDQALKEGAPDDEIKAQAGFVSDKTSRTGVTRKMRLKLLMQKYRGAISESDLDPVEAACDLVLSIDTKLQAYSHARTTPSVADVKDSLAAAEIALRRVLVP
jgi:hypothetical protein